MLEKSKYLPFFIANRERLAPEMNLYGDILLVERIKFPEKKLGSLFIPDAGKNQVGGLTSENLVFYRVLLVGQGYYDPDTGKDEPLDIEQGAIIYTPAGGVKVWSSFPMLETTDSDVLGVTNHANIQIRWKTQEAFEKFLTDFNIAVKNEMVALPKP